MPINVNDDGVATVTLANGRELVLPEIVTALAMDAGDPRFHNYDVDSFVGFRSLEDWDRHYGPHVGRPFNMGPTTRDEVFMALRHVPAPENLVDPSHIEGAAVKTGDVTKVAVMGDVTHLLYPDDGVIVNVTLPGHRLHPGIVVRQVVEKDGLFSIVTEGVGTGPMKKLNEKLADFIWSSDDYSYSLSGGVDTRLMLVLSAFEGRSIPEVIERDPVSGQLRGAADPSRQSDLTANPESGPDTDQESGQEFGQETGAISPERALEDAIEMAPQGQTDHQTGSEAELAVPGRQGALQPGNAGDAIGPDGRGGLPMSAQNRQTSYGRFRRFRSGEAGEEAARADYEELFRKSFLDMGGDQDAAELLAIERFAQFWSVSSFTPDAEGTVLRHPVEAVYPKDGGGSHEYVRAEAARALREAGIDTKHLYVAPNERTGSDWRMGAVDSDGYGPRMTLSYEDAASGGLRILTDAFQVPVPTGRDTSVAQDAR